MLNRIKRCGPGEIFQAPRSWVQLGYPTLRYYNKPARGGHFAAWEEPQRSNAKHYTSTTVTEVVEFDGPHLLPARDGGEEIADYALNWAVRHARHGNSRQAPTTGP